MYYGNKHNGDLILKKNQKVLLILIFIIISVTGIFLGLNSLSTEKKKIYSYDIKLAFPNLTFNHPVGIYEPGDGTNRIFILEQRGIIYVFNNTANVTKREIFLDIQEKVIFQGEMGLLGLAFHPNYNINGYFYIDYVTDDPRRTIISRFTVNSTDPNKANSSSEINILSVEQPFTNHNGGQIIFGPDDYLYIGLGDGGSGGDPYGNAQNLNTLLGSILRIDVDSGDPYSIPPDNPFVNTTYRREIYAYGLRNPWRFSFDNETGWLWAADNGQSSWEEIDIIEKGKNYGWNIMEGAHCYLPPFACNTTNLELPIFEYSHDVGHSIIGGFVYYGPSLLNLTGSYIYGDYEYGQIWALEYDGIHKTNNTILVNTDLEITSFGIDASSELYFCAFDGNIYKLIESV